MKGESTGTFVYPVYCIVSVALYHELQIHSMSDSKENVANLAEISASFKVHCSIFNFVIIRQTSVSCILEKIGFILIRIWKVKFVLLMERE